MDWFPLATGAGAESKENGNLLIPIPIPIATPFLLPLERKAPYASDYVAIGN